MDKINIKNLGVFAHHGVFPEEKNKGQTFYVSAILYTDLRTAGITDNLTETINYGEICHVITDFIKNNTFDLIETVAERLARKLLVEYPSMKKMSLEIKKPSAPIGLSLETVSVEIERSWHEVFIGVGSNMGDKEANLRFAVNELEKVHGCRVLKVSKFISTAPYGYTEQDDFLNGCIMIETLLTPHELLDLLLNIEAAAGRVRDLRWGPRTLDLDIELYDDEIIRSDRLVVPHPEMHKRDFVLEPLCEIAPYTVHPIYRKTVKELLEDTK